MALDLPAAMDATLAGDKLRLIRLVELRLSQATRYYALAANDVTWNSLTWTATSGAFSAIRQSTGRQAPQFRLSLQNVDGVLGALVDPLVGGSDPRGRRAVIRTITEADYADSTAVVPCPLVIENFLATRTEVVFMLGSPMATQIRVPSVSAQGLRCEYVYKDQDCQSVATHATCNKTLEECRQRFPVGAPLRFSMGPGRARHRRVFFV